MIDPKIRSCGIGASEIAAIVGIDPSRDAHDIWAMKTGRLKIPESGPNSRPAWGTRLQQAVIQGYSEICEVPAVFVDETYYNPDRPWQIASPDAFVVQSRSCQKTAGMKARHLQFPSGTIIMNAVHGVDAKCLSLDQAGKYDSDTGIIPDQVALQCHWSCSTFSLPFWDDAVLVGGNNLKTFRTHRDPVIEKDILAIADEFWRKNVLEDVEPPIGATDGATEYLKQRFPKNVEQLRTANEDEAALLMELWAARIAFTQAESEKDRLSNATRNAIGDGEGLLLGPHKVTWRKEKDSFGTNWQTVSGELFMAISLALDIVESAYACPEWQAGYRTEDRDKIHEMIRNIDRAELEARHHVRTREGARKFICSFKETK